MTIHSYIPQLHVSEFNLPALTLYKKFGFTPASWIVKYYLDEGEDAIELKKGESIRLLGIGIVKIIEDGLDLAAEYISENAENIEKKIQN